MAVVALSAVPVISVGAVSVATSGNAFAAGKSTTCTGGPGSVKFAAPGLSDLGTASVSAKSKAKTTAGPITCTGGKKGNGTLAVSKITSTSTTTCASDSTPPSPCPSGDFVYDSAGQFASGSGTLFQSVPTTSWTIGTTTYTASNTGSASATCPTGEVGFVLTGHLTAPASLSGKATTITACLNGDTGTGTSGSFQADLFGELGGNTVTIIKTALFDPAASSIVFA
jgi:hypothetical protein